MRKAPDLSPWKTQYNDLVRSFTGVFLFGIPFIYTMEMWWISTYIDIWKLLIFLAIALAINIHLGHLIHLPLSSNWSTAVGEALYNIGVGMVGALVILFLLGRIVFGDPLNESLGKILLETIPLSIGAAVTRKIERESEVRRNRPAVQEGTRHWNVVLNQIGITLAGSLFLSLPLASTDEIQMLAAGTTDYQVIALVPFSLLVGYIIVYRDSLAPTWAGDARPGRLPVLVDILMTYGVSFFAALATLYLFDRIELGNPLVHVVSQTVVLGLPATVGGAAGRRLI